MDEKNWSILLVDDDSTTNFLNEIVIKDTAPEIPVSVFLDANQALRELEEISEKADAPQAILIFFDLNMPVMDGFEFLDELQLNNFPNIHIVITMLTSSINKKDVDRANQYDLYDFVEKPLSGEKLNRIFADLGISE